MGWKRLGCATFVSIFVGVSVPLRLNSTELFSKTSLLAFSINARKAEAERWLNQGIEQLRQQEWDAAIQSSQQALTLYQDTRDRVGIADKLPTDPNDHVIFIPQQSLLMIPFSPLQDESGNYLLEKHTILTAPAIMVLDITRQTRVNRSDSVQQCYGRGSH